MILTQLTLKVTSTEDQDQALKIMRAVADILKLQGHKVCLSTEQLTDGVALDLYAIDN